MGRTARTYEWHGDKIVESSPAQFKKKPVQKRRPKIARQERLSLNGAILLFAGSVSAMLICIPLLMALLYVAYGIIFGQ